MENLLIHHPDTLLTPSLLASAPNCQCRPLVTALVRAPSPPTPALVYGTVLHDVVQKCLKEKHWDTPWIEARVDTTLSMAFGDLVRAGRHPFCGQGRDFMSSCWGQDIRRTVHWGQT